MTTPCLPPTLKREIENLKRRVAVLERASTGKLSYRQMLPTFAYDIRWYGAPRDNPTFVGMGALFPPKVTDAQTVPFAAQVIDPRYPVFVTTFEVVVHGGAQVAVDCQTGSYDQTPGRRTRRQEFREPPRGPNNTHWARYQVTLEWLHGLTLIDRDVVTARHLNLSFIGYRAYHIGGDTTLDAIMVWPTLSMLAPLDYYPEATREGTWRTKLVSIG
ncbi:hypothetical protein GCM10012275_19190 [Longimycelium tulufanense]|uniref:Uncharacterized protein n=1 Tax=Longimycelium tulufanense TaxID=907463 RepID=A0A8J3FTC5_9PSEU|nr:hypothetical protein [Longimycelium tulufanense]GGM48338.1 hypothetical protein GCM10012275_19190 [Longimycelium tulufanense]